MQDDEGVDTPLIIEGIASTTSRDLQGDSVLPSAIQSMKKQALTKNLYGDHSYGLFQGLIGTITDVLDTDDDELRIKARILPKYSKDIREMLDTGIQLGLSVGGKVQDYTRNDDGTLMVKDINLLEISLTGMPANLDTSGTITTSKGLVKTNCVEGACKVILKSMENNIMANEDKTNEKTTEENKDTSSEPLTEEQVVSLFNEMMAEKQEEIVKSTVETVQKDLEKIVDERISELKEKPEEPEETKSQSKPEPEDEDEEEETKSKSQSEPEDEDEEEEEDKIKKAVDDAMADFFKSLNDNRKPAPQVNKSVNTADNSSKDDGMTPEEIAKSMYGGSQKDAFIKSIFG